MGAVSVVQLIVAFSMLPCMVALFMPPFAVLLVIGICDVILVYCGYMLIDDIKKEKVKVNPFFFMTVFMIELIFGSIILILIPVIPAAILASSALIPLGTINLTFFIRLNKQVGFFPIRFQKEKTI